MYIKEMSNALEEFHSFMETQANRTVFQTPEWGEVKADGSWTKDVLLVMTDAHEPVAAAEFEPESCDRLLAPDSRGASPSSLFII